MILPFVPRNVTPPPPMRFKSQRVSKRVATRMRGAADMSARRFHGVTLPLSSAFRAASPRCFIHFLLRHHCPVHHLCTSSAHTLRISSAVCMYVLLPGGTLTTRLALFCVSCVLLFYAGVDFDPVWFF